MGGVQTSCHGWEHFELKEGRVVNKVLDTVRSWTNETLIEYKWINDTSSEGVHQSPCGNSDNDVRESRTLVENVTNITDYHPVWTYDIKFSKPSRKSSTKYSNNGSRICPKGFTVSIYNELKFCFGDDPYWIEDRREIGVNCSAGDAFPGMGWGTQEEGGYSVDSWGRITYH